VNGFTSHLSIKELAVRSESAESAHRTGSFLR
jgi:hypothetical protein